MRIVDVTPADLNAALRDPAVRAIRVAGYRILDDLDVAAVRRDPKPIIGTGDTTFVHLELWRRCGSVGYHGSDQPELAPIKLCASKARTSQASGHASGTLLGGSLAAVRAMIGAGLPDLTGAILLLTGERTQGLGQVDRQLTHLRRAGIRGSVAAVAVGVFTGFDGYVDRGWTLRDVLHDHLSRLTVPVLTGLPIGPGRPAVPIGTNAHLDATKRTLTIDAAVS
ncbi:LD-carboxypeptidase [Actinoplanes sp. NPDC051633]|uniref:LD-carboxypeptidase n=1 Tax=Actinoplanes sp. NPDC051633 TaxID=3155670 RepID=UPI0034384D9F